MPVQYENYRHSRLIMSVLRCFKNALQLWIMIHAASVVIVYEKRFIRGYFWDTRLPDKLTYYDALTKVPASEFCVLAIVALKLRSIYDAFGCKFVGTQSLEQIARKPRIEYICACTPYMGAFLSCWVFSTFLIMRQISMGPPYHDNFGFYYPLFFGLLFKILILTNMISLWLRVYVRLFQIGGEWNRGRISTQNLGERLNLLFSN